MAEQQKAHSKNATAPAFRIDTQFHEILTKGTKAASPPAGGQAQELPTPVFPQYPHLLQVDDSKFQASRGISNPYRRRWTAPHIYRAMRGWLFPYVKSRILPGDFHPIIAYLFTEWKCNLDCHYCWAFDNRVKGMAEDIA
ncbi:MAG: hypothetical protein HY645_02465 [Acidobacteria bacterium]|nr:hypothetical protein [Acidobacteriota bacterium]